MRVQTHHARIPQKATFDYAIRPESIAIESESKKRPRMEEIESDTHARIQKKLASSLKPKGKTRR